MIVRSLSDYWELGVEDMSPALGASLRFGFFVEAIWSTRCLMQITIVCVTPLLILGCMSATSPHENFLRNLHMAVGRDIRSHSEFRAYQRTNLPNGHSEYRLSRRIPPG